MTDQPLTRERLQRLGNIVANLAHPKGDHRQNDLEDEAHDIIRELLAQVQAPGCWCPHCSCICVNCEKCGDEVDLR